MADARIQAAIIDRSLPSSARGTVIHQRGKWLPAIEHVDHRVDLWRCSAASHIAPDHRCRPTSFVLDRPCTPCLALSRSAVSADPSTARLGDARSTSTLHNAHVLLYQPLCTV